MIDISRKTSTLRIATAESTIRMRPETIERIKKNEIPKGNTLEVARVAGIQAAKNSAAIIPFSHSVPVESVGIVFAVGEREIIITATVKAVFKIGVEMEALTATTVAALTIYDMVKACDETLEISRVRLVSRKGGKADYAERFDKPLRAAVLVISDAIAAGKKEDLAGKLIESRLHDENIRIEDYKVIPDDLALIIAALQHYADKLNLDIVLTAGSTGFSPRDCAPEAMSKVFEREIPGIPEILRTYGQQRSPYSMLSRGKAGIRGRTMIINLPGSKRGAAESLDALFPGLLHSFKMLWGGGHPEKKNRMEAES